MNKQTETHFTKNPEETKKLAEDFVKTLGKNNVIALYGELGSGKTTFVQGLIRGIGIKKRIISPTFIILRTYKIKLKYQSSKVKSETQKVQFLFHIDLYRIRDEKDIEGLGIDEIITDNKNIVAIEWAEKMKNLLPKKRTDIYFEYLAESKRKITIFRT